MEDFKICDIVTYWNDINKIQKFPRLYYAFIYVTDVMATETSTERLFSKSGYISSARRNKLGDNRLHQISFLNSNYNAKY